MVSKSFLTTNQTKIMPEISYDDFLKLDLRVAKILTVEKIPGKSRIIKGIIDLVS